MPKGDRSPEREECEKQKKEGENLVRNRLLKELVYKLKSEDILVRVNAVSTLGGLGAKKYIPEIMELLNDRCAVVQAFAIDALGKLGAKKAIPRIIKLLKNAYKLLKNKSKKEIFLDDNLIHQDHIRHCAITALGKLNAKEVIPELMKMLKDKTGIIEPVLIALGELSVKEFIPYFTNLRSDKSERIRHEASCILSRLKRTKKRYKQKKS